MQTLKKQLAGVTRVFIVIIASAATLALGGAAKASAKSEHHHHRQVAQAARHLIQGADKRSETSWRNANAMAPTASGHTFSGVASFYGNESGSKTASGEHFNENAMTCAHRSLPFGTVSRDVHRELRVSFVLRPHRLESFDLPARQS